MNRAMSASNSVLFGTSHLSDPFSVSTPPSYPIYFFVIHPIVWNNFWQHCSKVVENCRKDLMGLIFPLTFFAALSSSEIHHRVSWDGDREESPLRRVQTKESKNNPEFRAALPSDRASVDVTTSILRRQEVLSNPFPDSVCLFVLEYCVRTYSCCSSPRPPHWSGGGPVRSAVGSFWVYLRWRSAWTSKRLESSLLLSRPIGLPRQDCVQQKCNVCSSGPYEIPSLVPTHSHSDTGTHIHTLTLSLSFSFTFGLFLSRI